ncbi:LPS export ABC transporter ATP-binding protein [Litorivicinus lipolyticus]|uniref:Lipopolysaccharide export system ATP-binding protein LptB n=1 Tax=Litorivicinus lipolyticus TaxID=418701 RepID=A0A5Q2QJQ9_9GAMM|nr:LPS export ABC transporter ATP-binding protein [Litorivicinus lipolyticus]
MTASGLAKRYGKRQVVKDMSVRVEPGEIVGLLGPNGAGKTTSFYMIVGLVKADSGAVTIDGQDVSRQPMHRRSQRGLGYLAQEASIFRRLSSRDNLLAVLELRRDLDKRQRQQKADALLAEFHLEHVADSLGQALSGGERRRVEIARALAMDPAYVLLDEPFAGVDPISVSDIKRLVRGLAARDIGVLITDHNVRETLDLCDRGYIVSDGSLLAQGSPQDLLANETVRQVYLGHEFRM